jgi:hypothetical protein
VALVTILLTLRHTCGIRGNWPRPFLTVALLSSAVFYLESMWSSLIQTWMDSKVLSLVESSRGNKLSGIHVKGSNVSKKLHFSQEVGVQI